MKPFGKDLLPLHFHPIVRDLLAVFFSSLAIAAALVSLGFILFH